MLVDPLGCNGSGEQVLPAVDRDGRSADVPGRVAYGEDSQVADILDIDRAPLGQPHRGGIEQRVEPADTAGRPRADRPWRQPPRTVRI